MSVNFPLQHITAHWGEFHVCEDVIKVVELQQFQLDHLMLQLKYPAGRDGSEKLYTQSLSCKLKVHYTELPL